jgi:hypothetical protein
MLTTFKKHNPKIDVKEKVYIRNDGLKYAELDNNCYTKVVIESERANIKVECSANNKKIAREYAAQKFLRVNFSFLFLILFLEIILSKNHEMDRISKLL